MNRFSKKAQTKSLIWSMAKADAKFSEFIRKRDGKCMRCGKKKSKGNPLTCSHFWPRQHKGTRYDPLNCVALCWMPCHKYHWEKEKQGAYRDFMLHWLGEDRYQEVKKRAESTYPLSRAISECMVLLGHGK